ncbi:2-amino-4-hydroxy-6-hydroxymethyldihydropteridine diphosphokinase [Candidatus Methylospira mobilis]|uniref:2-amino-4-hydroxy-6-hydroxymethyldihydropteridine pyrophosphokinase n=1 Tax=Candidatus Methylospira mobilis TaxID=1808979 RepID=A0A5Q0BGW0_9GAMM|nr:2-amino-4-hydroxy-6-hydroxymethyldihydropteridine diphosphokinase [Candidatus Methylospira mobilis]QFY41451.1 2-amino-4-hydroxy-6-hydroxymethyldihydropteridine diphosphokinase [Candidatus Methylospira mobilis]
MNSFREEVTAYLGLGSNLADPASQLRRARAEIAGLTGVSERAFSSFYHSAPMGPADQPDYVNAVMAVDVTLDAHELLRALQAIELMHGRDRSGRRWGARTLDIDILLYGQEQLHYEDLTVPHPGMTEREFVLYPLAEIAPAGLEIPGGGRLDDWLARCPKRGLEVLSVD